MKLPAVWMMTRKSQMQNEFLSRFNEGMDDKKLPCKACTEIDQVTSHQPWIIESDGNYGSQNYSCSDCNEHFCRDCEGSHMPRFCDYCKEKAFTECGTLTKCAGCNEHCCDECDKIEDGCAGCHRRFYDCRFLDDYNCVIGTCNCCGRQRCYQCVPILTCETCDQRTCSQCTNITVNDVQYCVECRVASCVSCLANEFHQGDNHYSACKSRIIPRLLHEIDTLLDGVV